MSLPDPWREYADSQGWTAAVDDDDLVVLQPPAGDAVRLDIGQTLSTPAIRLVVDSQDVAIVFDAGAVVGRIEVVLRRRDPAQIVHLHNSGPDELVIIGSPPLAVHPWEPCRLTLDQTDLERLVLENLAVEVQGRSVGSLALVDSGAHFNGSAISVVDVQGSCYLSASNVERLSGTPGSHLHLWSVNADDARFPLEMLASTVGLTVFGGHAVTTGGLAPGAVVELENGILHINGAADRATFRGWGAVRIGETSRLQSPMFERNGDRRAGEAMVLTVRSSTVDEAAGTLDVLDLAGESSIVGKNDGSFVVRKILLNSEAMPVAELEGVSAYELRAIDLQVVERSCRRFRPWFESSASERARREGLMTFGSTDERLVTQRRAEYWARMERLLTEQRAGGELLSHAREASLRSRLHAARKFSREWWVLAAYAVIGYGERITRPLFIYAGLCAIGAVGLRWSDSAVNVPGRRLLLYLLAAPLTLLRIDSVAMPNSPGIWDIAVHSSLKAVGVALLASSLLAARRIGRGT